LVWSRIMRLNVRAIEALRRERGRLVTLVVTDRCPVGCGHCNVDSRADGETIEDFARYDEILAALAVETEIEVVAVTGGEPFVERQGLALATRRLTAAGKQVAVYTSGMWAAHARVPGWIHDVLARCECVVLSTDRFHADAVGPETLIRAAREVIAAEAWLIVQVLDEGDAHKQAAELLNQAFGGRWDQHAEIAVVEPLRQGRGLGCFRPRERVVGHSFGACPQLATPTIRYDGVLVACANETVGLGLGPERLRQRFASADQLRAGLARLRSDPLVRVLAEAGFSTLVRHPKLRELGQERYEDRCGLCWKALAELGPDRAGRVDPDLDALAAELDEGAS
jgi:organic radical activating enzyme